MYLTSVALDGAIAQQRHITSTNTDQHDNPRVLHKTNYLVPRQLNRHIYCLRADNLDGVQSDA